MKCKYNIRNLDCANCARKIEEELNKNSEINDAKVNFNTLKLTFETDNSKPMDLVKKIVNKVEPEVIIYENEIEEVNTSNQIIRLIIGVILGIVGTTIKLPLFFNKVITIIAYAILLARTVKNAYKLLIKSKTINENFLITISCIGAYSVGEHLEGLMVITLYEIGKILEDKALNNSRKAIKELMDIKPEYANLKTKSGFKKINPSEIKINDIIVVKNGEKIPLDGVIVDGTTTLDVSALTGESLPKDVEVDDEVLSGSINLGSVIEIRVTNTFENSTVNKILELVENATDRKARTETFVARIAKIYTPVVLILAIITAGTLPLFTNFTYSMSIYKALIFLVISCPCAIAISVPLSYFTAIGKASRNGILIKGSDYLDNLKNVNLIAFDKTGTLTKGEFKITKINCYQDYKEQEILDLIAIGEYYSNHPLAKAILSEIDYKLDIDRVKQFKEIAGLGLEYKIGNDKYLVGNAKLVSFNDPTNNTTIFVKKNKDIIGNIELSDTLKENTKEVIEKLKNRNISVYMLTGDSESHAQKIAKELNVSYEAEMLPTDKFTVLEKLKENNKVAFVGDGLNDSPVLALADIGIAMGGVGSTSAIEAASIVIMNDDLSKINDAINLSFRTNRIIKQNLIFAITTKVLILILSVLGVANMWEAIFADVGVTLITILNTLRIMRH